MRTLFGFPGDGGGKVDHLVLALGLIRCTCREEDKWAAHTWVSQSDTPGIVEVSGTQLCYRHGQNAAADTCHRMDDRVVGHCRMGV